MINIEIINKLLRPLPYGRTRGPSVFPTFEGLQPFREHNKQSKKEYNKKLTKNNY